MKSILSGKAKSVFKRKEDLQLPRVAFNIFNYAFLFIFSLSAVIPFLYVVSGSLMPADEFISQKFSLIPKHITFDAYAYIFSTDTLLRSLMVSLFVTIVGTLTNLVLTVLMAYPLSFNTLAGRKTIMLGVIFTMLFSGGMIPGYLVVKMTGLINSLWSMILPGAISAFNLIVLKNFFQQLPKELIESAKIDGYNDVSILARIIVPLSLPAIATFALFYSVGHWNDYFSAILFINKSDKWPIQLLLRQIVILTEIGIGNSAINRDKFYVPPATVKMATIFITAVPILMVYPFLQRYFVKGIFLGSVKG